MILAFTLSTWLIWSPPQIYGVDRADARQNILCGAACLARLLKKHGGNFRLAVREYNGTGYRPYENEVVKAANQAERRANVQFSR